MGIEKVRIALEMATYWTDPTMMLVFCVIGGIAANLVLPIVIAYYFGITYVPIPFIAEYIWYNYIYMRRVPAPTSKYLTFKHAGLKAAYANSRIPMVTLADAYIDGQIDFVGDVWETLDQHRDEFVNYKVTFTQAKWLIRQLFPNQHNSSNKDVKSTHKEIAEHYDRGNDFFNAFMGPSMVYTSGVYRGLDQSLEQAQFNKMSLICDKLGVKKGEKFLDIGCGWGTLVRHAAKYFGATSTGVTLSAEGAKWCNDKNEEENLTDKCKILYMDYRQIPDVTVEDRFPNIASIEMAEHVGLKNFPVYLNKVKHLLTDDGSFLMQVAGLRQGSNWQDVAWGLFMSRYIFPGADASTPLNWYIRQLEQAGFEVQSVETIGRHYSHTLHAWYDNFQRNKAKMEEKYGARLCRMWSIFLAWSVVAAGQGSATCYQILSHKNTYDWPRDKYTTGEPGLTGVGIVNEAVEARGAERQRRGAPL